MNVKRVCSSGDFGTALAGFALGFGVCTLLCKVYDVYIDAEIRRAFPKRRETR
nr:MAG TPA: hypothetical protein [Caudoviricetes sp.]DAZ51938.1 MAG TPA: hypothetical protein [Caudoviricetes sp.]